MRSLICAICLALTACGSNPQTLDEALIAAERAANSGADDFFNPEFEKARLTARIEAPATLVVQSTNVAVITRTYDPRRMEREIRADVCRSAPLRNIIELGGTVRLETTTHIGDRLPALYFTRC